MSGKTKILDTVLLGLTFFAMLLSLYAIFLYAPIEKIMGVALVATGVAFLTGSINDLGFWLLETFPSLGRVG